MTSIGPIGSSPGPIRGDARETAKTRTSLLSSADTANETRNGEANARATEARARQASSSSNNGGDVGGVLDVRG